MYEFGSKLSKSHKEKTERKKENKRDCLTRLFGHLRVIWALLVRPQSIGQNNENTSAEMQICSRRSAQTQTSSQTNTAAGVWWMMLSSGGCTSLGRRTNFVPSSVDCLSFLVSDEPGGDSGKQCSVSVTGVHNTSRSSTVLCVTHTGPWKLDGQHGDDGLPIRTGSQAGSRVSSCVACLLLHVESSVSRAASGSVTDTGS